MAEKVYAFGDDSINEFACPAVAAGRDMPDDDAALTVAEEYDSIVQLRFGIDEGTLPESVAESCWEEAIGSILSNAEYYEGRDNEHAEYLYDAADVGRDIATGLF